MLFCSDLNSSNYSVFLPPRIYFFMNHIFDVDYCISSNKHPIAHKYHISAAPLTIRPE